MNKSLSISLVILIGLLGYPDSVRSQGPPPPKPIIETEIQQNSTDIRSKMLDMMKRTRKSENPLKPSEERALYKRIKRDFEQIQVLLARIVQVYKTGKTINYKRIKGLSTSFSESAIRLCSNIFEKPEEVIVKTRQISPEKRHRRLRSLIISLHRDVGKFVSSPVFANKTKVNARELDRARKRLLSIIKTSKILENI